MKLIFSRKGYDSSAGGFPSLIFPDGTLYSIPIPSSKDNIFYSDLRMEYEGESIQSILNDLTGHSIRHNKNHKTCDYMAAIQRCHYDPMPVDELTNIAFGQTGGSESHLRKQNIEEGDIFLFYGWFKQVEKNSGAWRYKPEAKDIHIIWGWMSVGEMINLDNPKQREVVSEQYPCLAKHPHLAPWRKAPNRIYLSDKSGFLSYSNQRCLTDCENYQGRSTWRLPSCFNQPEAITYLNKFSLCGGQVIITIPGRGQEFVLNLEKVESIESVNRIIDWINKLIEDSKTTTGSKLVLDMTP